MLSRRPARTAVLVLLAALLAGGAAFVVSGSGAQQPLGPQVVSVRGSVLMVADPVGGPRWRIESSRHGPLVCVLARRLGRGNPRDPRGNVALGGCEDTRSHTPGQAVVSRWVGGRSPRTLVMGYARRSVRRVTITGPGGARSFDLSARGRVFLGVFAGVIEPRHFGAGLTMENGTHKSFGLGSPMATYAADPDHGTPWTARGYRFVRGPRAGQTCVTVMREPPRFGPLRVEGGRRPVCADLSGPAYFFKIVRTRGRTMVVGAAGATVTSVEVRANGETRSAPLAARGRAFLAVFGANVRAYDLTVVIHKLHGTNMFSGQASMNLGFNRTRGPLTQFRVRPSEGTVTTAFSVWFVPPVPIDNSLDIYSVSFTGPGGPRCRELNTWQTGITWNPRYNARNARRGTSIGFSPRRSIQGSLIPNSSEPWCPGTFNGVLRFRDTPRTGGRSRARNLVHFRFRVRSDPGRDASQGLCPSMPFERVGVGDIAGLRSAVLAQVPQIYRGTNLKQMRIVRFVHAPRDRDRGGYARVKCGAKGWRRTYVAYLEFPAMHPSASLSQGVVLVGRFGGRYRIWARLH